MSPAGHSDSRRAAILVGSFEMERAARFDLHTHSRHQLAWAARGVLAVSVREGTWVLPPTRALWIPAGTAHVTAAATAASLRSLYAEPAKCPIAWADPTVVVVGGLLRNLMLHLAREDLGEMARARAEAVVYDLLDPAPVAMIAIAMPSDARARTVAAALVADPADGRTLAAWARTVGASERTLARAFADTGLGFGAWRTQVRLKAALPLLAGGLPVATAGRRVGYATSSAFVAAFRRALGLTPGEYFASPTDGRGAVDSWYLSSG